MIDQMYQPSRLKEKQGGVGGHFTHYMVVMMMMMMTVEVVVAGITPHDHDTVYKRNINRPPQQHHHQISPNPLLLIML